MDNKEIAGIVAISTLLTACGGGGDSGTSPSPSPSPSPAPAPSPSPPPAPVYLKPATQAESARFLLQTQFDTNLNEINSLMNSTYQDYLNTQFNLPISQTGWDWLNSKGYDIVNTYAYFDNTYPGDSMTWQQLISSPDGFRKKIALALSEFFVVSLSGLNMGWRSHALASWWDMLNANCFGNFRMLLGNVTLHPAMGNYLNLAGSKKENSSGRQPDENYAREVMQLFSLGIYQLNLDGTEKTDANGNKLETYTQADITNLARALTGWNYDQSQNVVTNIVISGNNRNVSNTKYTTLPMTLTASDHSVLGTSLLGSSLPTDGQGAMNTSLDIIFNHDNIAPFFCKQMIKKLVTSNPSPQYVQRVATIFNNNGSGVKGDLKAVFSAIFLDKEARDLSNISLPTFGKVREPMHRFIQWSRTFKCTSKYGYWKIGDRTNNLGQSPLRSPSVFNFFRPNYVPPSTQLATLQLTAPEFQIVNESTVSSYINFMQNILKSGIYINGPDIPNNASTANNGYDFAPDYTEALTYITDSTGLINYLDLVLTANQTSESNKKLMISAIDSFGVTSTSNSSAGTQLNKLASAILLIVSNSDYIVQK